MVEQSDLQSCNTVTRTHKSRLDETHWLELTINASCPPVRYDSFPCELSQLFMKVFIIYGFYWVSNAFELPLFCVLFWPGMFSTFITETREDWVQNPGFLFFSYEDFLNLFYALRSNYPVISHLVVLVEVVSYLTLIISVFVTVLCDWRLLCCFLWMWMVEATVSLLALQFTLWVLSTA